MDSSTKVGPAVFISLPSSSPSSSSLLPSPPLPLLPSHSVRLALVSSVKEVRAGALRVLRYLIQSAEVLDTMMKLRIDILVAR